MELRKLLIKHVLSDATDEHVQAAPIAVHILERVINEDNLGDMGGFVAEDAMKDVHADVQKHAKRLSPTQDSFQGTRGARGSS